ncbi:hypothetical protein [Cellulomonas sp. URHE0023]|uniref:hypothetical protein n=1 Tax=Cellulomonas sp. URHE0023 TaxID=1380354 RepID=UPI0004821010|nr:hypothetical protein [Cellulomonas sp. URHE0023]
MTHSSDAPTLQLPALRSAGSTGRRRADDHRGSVPIEVLEATRSGLVDLDDHAPRQLTGTAPPVPVLSISF